MAEIGQMAVHLALAVAIYSAAGSGLGAWKRHQPLMESARYAAYLIVPVLALATASLVYSFLQRDFQVRYVSQHSNLAMEPWLTWVAFYAGNEGSLLYIALALSLLSAIAIRVGTAQSPRVTPPASAVLMLVLSFFLAVIAFLASPFVRLPVAPPDGQGINPLLTHPGMFIHPPVMMAGLVGVTVPFAFAMGALLTGRTKEWIDAGRMWGLIVWAILGSGLLLGAWWAYTILGWGGYWGWDPIENVGFMPFLALTAFVHTVMVQKRRGIFPRWNIVLVFIAFSLSLLGMFFNRGGPVPSVHSFGQSTLGWVFLGFMGIGTSVSFALFFTLQHRLESPQGLESPLSREAAFLLNNLLLLGVAFVTLWGVVFPLISQIFQGREVTVGAPFYNQINGPLFLMLILLMGVGPYVPWRKASWGNMKRSLSIPTLFSVAVTLVLLSIGITRPLALLAFGISAFVVAGIFQEWLRGAISRHRQGENYLTGFAKLIASNRPRYGGYTVHLAIVLVALAVAGSSFYGIQRDVVLMPGEKATIQDYSIQYISTAVTPMTDRTEYQAMVRISRGDNSLGTFYPWRAFYPDFRMSATRAAIRSTPIEDLYIIPSESTEGGGAVFRVLINPLVWWMWVAGPVLVLGTLVSLWPEARPKITPLPSVPTAEPAETSPDPEQLQRSSQP